MPVPEEDALRIARWCQGHSPENLRDQLRIECEIADRNVTIMESRPPWDGSNRDWDQVPVARLRYTSKTSLWSLQWQDSDLRFRDYQDAPPTTDVRTLLDAIDDDLDNLFWG